MVDAEYQKAQDYVFDYLKMNDSISFENMLGLCPKRIDKYKLSEVLQNMNREGWFIPNPEFPSSPWLKISSYGKDQLKHERPLFTPPKRLGQLIEDTTLPDDFYIKLVDELNLLYRNNHPIPISILLRKLLENLIIDILRKRYGMRDVSIFFNVSEGRFSTFSKLLRNISERKSDFTGITSNLDMILPKIEKFRERGNSAAHSIEVDITMDQIESTKGDINYLVPALVSIRQRL